MWDEGREEAIDRLLAPDAKLYGLSGPGGPPLVGPAGFKPVFRTFREAFGDLTIAVERTVTEGDTVAVYCHVTGRHVGDALGGKPTNRSVDLYGVAIGRVQNGRLVEGWNVFDFLTMYQQIGWVKSPPLP